MEELWSARDDANLVLSLERARSSDLVGALFAIEGASRERQANGIGLLDAWGRRLASRGPLRHPIRQAEALADFLGGEVGLRGDDEDYYAVANSRLSHVLSRRRGMPILLSLVWMEIGRRASIPVEGIGMPGHFIVRVGGSRGVYADPFSGGRLLSTTDCREIVERLGGPAWNDDFLQPTPPEEILERILQNLYHACGRAQDTAGQYRAATFLAALRPDSPERLLARAAAARTLGDAVLARTLYTELAERFPDTEEADTATQALEEELPEPPAN